MTKWVKGKKDWEKNAPFFPHSQVKKIFFLYKHEKTLSINGKNYSPLLYVKNVYKCSTSEKKYVFWINAPNNSKYSPHRTHIKEKETEEKKKGIINIHSQT